MKKMDGRGAEHSHLPQIDSSVGVSIDLGCDGGSAVPGDLSARGSGTLSGDPVADHSDVSVCLLSSGSMSGDPAVDHSDVSVYCPLAPCLGTQR